MLIEEQHALSERVAEAMSRAKRRAARLDATRCRTLTDSLHSDIRAVRMLPVSGALAPFGRMVRDLGRAIDKRVGLKIVGGDTEVDRDVLEAIKDPIMHLLRNAVDHGIESRAAARGRCDKPAEALIEVRARSRGGSLELEVSDDGRGINARERGSGGLERGLATAEQLARDERGGRSELRLSRRLQHRAAR